MGISQYPKSQDLSLIMGGLQENVARIKYYRTLPSLLYPKRDNSQSVDDHCCDS
jgi:hypothetical protein